MKRILYLFILAAAVSCSEQAEKNNVEAINASTNASGSFGKWNGKAFTGVIGIVNKVDESMSFKVEEKALLTSFNNFFFRRTLFK